MIREVVHGTERLPTFADAICSAGSFTNTKPPELAHPARSGSKNED